MASLSVLSSNGFDSKSLWVSSISSDDNAQLAGYQSTSFSGPLLFQTRTDTYSSFTFNKDEITYEYRGSFTVTSQPGLLSGSVAAKGSYNEIFVYSNGTPVALYSGDSIDVDFGSAQAGVLPSTLEGVLGLANNLLFGPSTTDNRSFANLNTDVTPDLPLKAFAGNDFITGGAGDDILRLGGGSNVAAGGLGDDTAVLDFKLIDARIGYDAAGNTIIEGPSGERNVITGFEEYTFTDGSVSQKNGSPLVDDLFYYANNKDVWQAGLDAEAHYNQFGWIEGRNPNAAFFTTGYLAANQDVAQAGVNPLTHYEQYGRLDGRDPAANFDLELYLAKNPDVKASGMDPLAHFLQYGQAEGRQTYAAVGSVSDLAERSGFDAEYYLLANADVAQAALNAGGDTFEFAQRHYNEYGWEYGRNPNAVFDTKGYLATYTDVAAAGMDPLEHYHKYGFSEGRDPSAQFDTKAYLAANPDVKAVGYDPMLHYLQYGGVEGRTAFNDGHFG